MNRSTLALIGFALLGFAILLLSMVITDVVALNPKRAEVQHQFALQLSHQAQAHINKLLQLQAFNAERLAAISPDDEPFARMSANLGLSGAAELTADGQFRSLTIDTGIEPQQLQQSLRPLFKLMRDPSQSQQAGLLNLPGGPSLLAWYKRPDDSAMITWSLWDQQLTARLQTDIGYPISVIDLHSKQANPQTRVIAENLLEARFQGHDLMWNVRDLNQHAMLLMVFDLEELLARTQYSSFALLIGIVGGSSALLLLVFLVHLRFLRPIIKLIRALQDHSPEQADRAISMIGGSTLIRRLIREYRTLLEKIDQGEKRALSFSHQLEKLSKRDPLTGLANRTQFDEFAQREWQRAQRTDSHLSLLCLELDHYNEIKTVLGPSQSDRLLKTFSELLKGNVHQATDLVARIEPTIFAIVLSDSDDTGAKKVGLKLQKAVHTLTLKSEFKPWPDPFSISVVYTQLDQQSSKGLGQTVNELCEQIEQLEMQAESALITI